MLRLLKFVNGILDFEEIRLNYIMILYKVKENFGKLLEYLLSKFKVNLKLDIYNSFKKILEFIRIVNIFVIENFVFLFIKVDIIKVEFLYLGKY